MIQMERDRNFIKGKIASEGGAFTGGLVMLMTERLFYRNWIKKVQV